MKNEHSKDDYVEIDINKYPRSCAICRNVGYTQYGLYCDIDNLYVQPNGSCIKFDLSTYLEENYEKRNVRNSRATKNRKFNKQEDRYS